MAIIHDQCRTISSLVDQLSDIKNYFEDIEEKISGFLTWQESAEGRSSNIPKIEEAHKEIVFIEWEIRIKQGEATIY